MKIDFAGNKRVFLVMVAVLFAFAGLVLQLADLTIVKGAEYEEVSNTRKWRTLTQVGSRGIIMDVNGIPLAYDQRSYDVHFYKDSSKTSADDRAYYTNVLMRTVEIIKKNNGTIIDTFAIKKNEKGDFIFDFGITNSEAVAKREKRWRSDMYVTSIEEPEDIYTHLRTKYQIPSELSYEEARPLLSIWQEVQLNAAKAYLPVVLSYNVDIQTVAELETYALELTGIEVAEGTIRIYPRRDSAAHIIGYMGKMVDEETIAEKQALGYSPNDKIGVAGIESSMELVLTPNTADRHGLKEVEVNNRGQIMRTFRETEPKSGNSVMLSIDIKMQLKLEKALEDNIIKLRQIQEDRYMKYKYAGEGTKDGYDTMLIKANRITQAEYDKDPTQSLVDKLNLANSGAAVVMDVNTGKVLAMASYPSFDLNLFTGGISKSEFDKLQDPKTAPLFNKAISSKSTPGSIFKMCVALGALMDDLDVTKKLIDCETKYEKTVNREYKGKVPECWYKNKVNHAHQTVADGLKNSCNFYFYTLAEEMGIEKINRWAGELGLSSKTGIELPLEATGQIGGQQVLYDNTKALNNQRSSIPILVYNRLKETLREIGEGGRNIVYQDTEITNAADRLIKVAGTGAPANTMGAEIRRILSEELSIPSSISSAKGWDNKIRDWLIELNWNSTRTILTGIGQEPILVTPIEVAVYISALANEGTVFKASIVDKIINPDGSVLEEVQPVVVNKINAKPKFWQDIKTGMSDVLRTDAGGTAGAYFKDFKYKDQMAAKTGTAQVSPIDLENNSWFVAFAPFDKPEIAVVVFIPNGYGAGQATPTAKDIVSYYLDQKDKELDIDIPTVNTVIGGNIEPSQSPSPQGQENE